MKKIDLHVHSAYSDDGEFSVAEILKLGQQFQVNYLSIADHNSVKSVKEALLLGPQMGVQTIAGVELDCIHRGMNLHLLGYHFDASHPAFAEIEQNIIKQEQNAAVKKIELIKKETGIPFREEDILGTAVNGVVTGELIAETLLKRRDAGEYLALRAYLPGGNRCDNPYVNFYWDYFSKGKPAYVPINYISLDEANNLIHQAGGISVLAHPGQSLKEDYSRLEQIVEIQIDGIEVCSSYHSRMDAVYFEAKTQEYKLLATCGSDFHGKTKPSIPLCGHRADEHMEAMIEALARKGIIE